MAHILLLGDGDRDGQEVEVRGARGQLSLELLAAISVKCRR